MPRPPFQSSPLNIFSRAGYEWISRINNKHRVLSELDPSTAEELETWTWCKAEFIRWTLLLRNQQDRSDQVGQVVTALEAGSRVNTTDSAVASISEIAAALETIRSRSRATEKEIRLDRELMTKLNPAHDFRAGDARDSQDRLSIAVDAALRWFAADSFKELNPVEQAAIVFLRIVELQPFESGNEETALLAASLFTMRAGLPPVIFKPDNLSHYHAALDAGSAMNTTPMVELIASSIEAALDRIAAIVRTRRGE
jgi:fido (protein-threonine AMPylation protein)